MTQSPDLVILCFLAARTCARASEMGVALRLTHHCDIVDTGNKSWRCKNRTSA